jgi:hypothetical protein
VARQIVLREEPGSIGGNRSGHDGAQQTALGESIPEDRLHGTFEATAGEEVIGHVGLGLERGASYDANLVVRWDGGEASCEASDPDGA